MVHFLTVVLAVAVHVGCTVCMLYPMDTETRTVFGLNDLWTFVREPLNSDGIGFVNEWFERDISLFQVRFE